MTGRREEMYEITFDDRDHVLVIHRACGERIEELGWMNWAKAVEWTTAHECAARKREPRRTGNG